MFCGCGIGFGWPKKGTFANQADQGLEESPRIVETLPNLINGGGSEFDPDPHELIKKFWTRRSRAPSPESVKGNVHGVAALEEKK
jgi:hypothetical protein